MRIYIFCSVMLISLWARSQSKPVNARADWAFRASGPVIGNAVIDHAGFIFVGDTNGQLYCIEDKKGAVIWSKQLPAPIRSTPALFNDTVFVLADNGILYAIDAIKGTTYWEFGTKGEKQYDFWDYYRSSPVRDKGYVYLGSGDHSVYAIEAGTGKLRWRYETEGIVHADPVISNDTLFIGSYDGYMYALNAVDGQLIWKFKTTGDRNFPKGEVPKAVLVDQEGVFFGSRDFNIYALNRNTGTGLWNRKEAGSWVIATPLLRNGKIYYGTSDTHAFYASSAADGATVWKQAIPFRSYNTPVASDTLIYAGCFDGKLYGFGERTGSCRWIFQTNGSKANSKGVFDEKGRFRKDFKLYGTDQETALAESRIIMLGAILATPVLRNGRLFFGATDGYFYAVPVK